MGDTSPALDPFRYTSYATACYAHYQQHFSPHVATSSIPLVINTQGWITGLGHMMLENIVSACQPTSIIEMRKEKEDDDDDVPRLITHTSKYYVLKRAPTHPRVSK